MTTPKPTRYSQPLGRWFTAGLCVFLLALAPLRLCAQQGGIVTGSVVDASTGKYLEGAEVSVDGTAIRTVTVREGAFVLPDVPAGPHMVTVTYPGLESKSATVNVVAGQTASAPFRLGSGEVITLSEFKVAGTKEGMAQAIALQRAAPNIKVVAAGDQYGDIAEGNAAEYLKFLPGVGIDYNANDARAATLRGMSTAFTNVTFNGSPIASATSGNLNRRFEFEQVAINNVETVEVIKTLTPEIPAISTGGLVNLVSKSAFDRQGDLFIYRAYLQATDTVLKFGKSEGYGQERTSKIFPGLDLNYAKYLRPNLGLTLSYKNSTLINDYPRSTYGWEYNPNNGGLPTNPALTSWNLQNEQKTTRRQSFSAQLDWKAGDHTKLTAGGMWNFYDLLFTDRTTTVNTGTLPALATGAAPTSYGNGTVTGRTGAGSVTFATINRWKSGVTWIGNLGLTHDFENGAQLGAAGSWSQSYSKYRDTTGSWFADTTVQRGGTNPATGTVTDPLTVTFTGVGGVAPRYTVVDSTGAAVDLRDLSKFTATTISSRPQTGVDTRDGFSLDYKMPLHTSVPTTVKVGARYDGTTRNIDSRIFRRSGNTPALGFGGASALTGSQLAALADPNFSNHPIGYGLPAYNFVSLYKAYTALGASYLPYLPASDTIARFDDSTKAGYIRLDATPLKNLLFIGGVRYEDQQTDSQNRLSTLPTIIKATFTSKKWFPSLNLKYTPNNNLVVRFGASKSIGLPDYSDLLPGPTTVTAPDLTSGKRGTAAIYNPNLKAYDVTSYDAGIEYYFSRSSVVSVSIFRKNFTNFIITSTQALSTDLATGLGIPSTLIVGPIDQYDVTYKFNVPEAGHYNGIEFGYSQNFSFLPKPFNTLGLQINSTLLSVDPINSKAVFSSTDANLNAAIRQQVDKSMEFAAVKQALNVTLNYSIGKFGLTLTSNYTGHVLKAFSQKTVKFTNVAVANQQYYNELQYQAPRELVDVRLDYKWSRKFTPYFQARNIFARPIVMATPIVPFNHAEYGDPIYELGVRGVW